MSLRQLLLIDWEVDRAGYKERKAIFLMYSIKPRANKQHYIYVPQITIFFFRFLAFSSATCRALHSSSLLADGNWRKKKKKDGMCWHIHMAFKWEITWNTGPRVGSQPPYVLWWVQRVQKLVAAVAAGERVWFSTGWKSLLEEEEKTWAMNSPQGI